jgi:tRNA uridine 5-carboxymethylaminomethyl modification enzyme
VLEPEVVTEVETEIRYGGYIARQEDWVRRARALEETRIPEDLVYSQLKGFSGEIVERLKSVRPATLGQASRLPGMTPAALGLLAVHVARRRDG